MNVSVKALPKLAAYSRLGALHSRQCLSLQRRAIKVQQPKRWISTSQLVRSQHATEQTTKQEGTDSPDRERTQDVDKKARQNQVHRPWHREGVDKPPGESDDDSIQKGKLLITPTHLLKLILPLPAALDKDKGHNGNGNEYGRSISFSDSIQPLALLIHPQQPLSYIERLIQAEIPPVLENGKEKIPNVYFRAEDADGQASEADNTKGDKKGSQASDRAQDRDNVASYSGLGHEGPKRHGSEKNWVRWSSSTEMGDFIRDAARGREFAIEIEGYSVEMRVSVPSFNDRTYYLRLRLRRVSRQIEDQARLKRECDLLAHQGAHRLAKGGFGLLAGWWGVVYYVTFHTEFGWDLVEPITYLAGLTTIMGGYLWFLYISRDLSYKAAMNVTVSRRQNALYEARGFDLERWEQLVREANSLRRDIRSIAVEYDVDWDEARDVGEGVKEVLDEEKGKKKTKSSSDKEEGGDFTENDKSKKGSAKKSKS